MIVASSDFIIRSTHYLLENVAARLTLTLSLTTLGILPRTRFRNEHIGICSPSEENYEPNRQVFRHILLGLHGNIHPSILLVFPVLKNAVTNFWIHIAFSSSWNGSRDFHAVNRIPRPLRSKIPQRKRQDFVGARNAFLLAYHIGLSLQTWFSR